MEMVNWSNRPHLREPVLLAAFEGWTDAGAAASGAASFLAGTWAGEPFAEIEPDEFYDFTAARPQVRLRQDLTREIVWPQNRFLSATLPGGPDVIFLIGTEPHLRWPTFSRCVTSVAQEMGVSSVFTLGAMLADVAHTRSVPVRGSTADADMAYRFALARPRYEGPTGIVGVLQDAFAQLEVPVASLMAQVPHYVPNAPSPKATLAVVERVCDILAVAVPTTDLEIASAAYERQVSEVVAADDDIAAYVRQLESRSDETELSAELDNLQSGDELAEELERFLREQGGSAGS
jgi:proteasome assembly chaperone (PAC2) family protein